MEIAILVVLFLVGTIASAMQAMKYLDRRRQQRDDRANKDEERS